MSLHIGKHILPWRYITIGAALTVGLAFLFLELYRYRTWQRPLAIRVDLPFENDTEVFDQILNQTLGVHQPAPNHLQIAHLHVR